MKNKIKKVDICCGLSWGDEAKGKIVSHLAKHGEYDFVCRWAGGNNAGHTIYKDNVKYKTHIIPCGIFYNTRSIIGPDCVINKDSFKKELAYLEQHGFDTTLIKISPKTHIITNEHIQQDIKKNKKQESTLNGISNCYKDKYARKGIQVKDDMYFQKFIWDEVLFGNVLCEGAQGFWLDINQGNYPYVTSSTTLPYGACSLGFSPKLIRNIYGACKIYDTRVGLDPEFPEKLLNNEDLLLVIKEGNEFGTTTGRMRKVNWLNINKLIEAINISGTSIVIMSKVDILDKVGIFKIIWNGLIIVFDSLSNMKNKIIDILNAECPDITNIIFSDNVETVDNLIEVI